MINWSNRITISDNVALLISSDFLDSVVEFVYIHNSGRENSRNMCLYDAILLAERRMDDKRYKNYEILIC